MKNMLDPKDLKLIVALLLIGILSIGTCFYGARNYEESMLRNRAEFEATHWAGFLQARLSNLPGILTTGSITAADEELLAFASEAGGIFRYKIFDADGMIIAASRKEDLGTINSKPYFADVVQKGGNFTKVVVKDISDVEGINQRVLETSDITADDLAGKATVSEVYVPFMKNGTFLGAVEIYMDGTELAAHLRAQSDKAIIALTVVLAIMGLCFAYFIGQNMRQRNLDIKRIKDTEEQLRKLNERLENRVEERTGELNEALQEVALFNEELEIRVDQRTMELQEAQAELLRSEQLAALGQMTASVSHELRNPLGAIRTAIFLIQGKTKDLDLDLDRAYERANRGVDRCDRIVSEMLDFARASEVVSQAVSIDEWLDQALAELVVPDGIQLQRESKSADIQIDFDGDRLRRAITNVFDNACYAMTEAMKEGNLKREFVLAIESRAGNGRFEMIFTDSGPGMEPEVLAKVFEPLFSTKRFGVGLGMQTVKQIMEMHSGGVDIKSTPGEGTSVTLWLPIEEQQIAHAEDAA